MLGSSGKLSCQKLENHETITRFLFKIIAPRHHYERISIFCWFLIFVFPASFDFNVLWILTFLIFVLVVSKIFQMSVICWTYVISPISVTCWFLRFSWFLYLFDSGAEIIVPDFCNVFIASFLWLCFEFNWIEWFRCFFKFLWIVWSLCLL